MPGCTLPVSLASTDLWAGGNQPTRSEGPDCCLPDSDRADLSAAQRAAQPALGVVVFGSDTGEPVAPPPAVLQIGTINSYAWSWASTSRICL